MHATTNFCVQVKETVEAISASTELLYPLWSELSTMMNVYLGSYVTALELAFFYFFKYSWGSLLSAITKISQILWSIYSNTYQMKRNPYIWFKCVTAPWPDYVKCIHVRRMHWKMFIAETTSMQDAQNPTFSNGCTKMSAYCILCFYSFHVGNASTYM